MIFRRADNIIGPYGYRMYPVLTILIFFPILAGMGLVLLPGHRAVRVYTLGASLVELLLALPLFTFNPGLPGFQFVDQAPWVPAWGLQYVVGIDGISILMVGLTLVLVPLCILCSWTTITKQVKGFHFLMLLMGGFCVGVFSALDFLLFYLFWEALLIPMYLIIAIWGGDHRDYAALKVILYTVAASVLLLVAIIAFRIAGGTFYIPDLMRRHFSFSLQGWAFWVMALAFAVKVPVFPFHTWLPTAYAQAPTAGSVLLAAVLAKMGTYGFLRFVLPLTPDAAIHFGPVILAAAIASIVYGGLLALGQSDVKKIIAYASMAHMGFILSGIFLFSDQGTRGAVLQMVNHGVTTAMLFILAGILYTRTQGRTVAQNQGLGPYLPAFMGFWGLAAFSGFAFPGTNTFVGEFLILTAGFDRSMWIGFFMVPGALLAAAYLLRLTRKMAWGQPVWRPVPKDLNPREWLILLPLAFLILYLGLAPGMCLRVMEHSVETSVQRVNQHPTSLSSRRDAETQRKPYFRIIKTPGDIPIAQPADKMWKAYDRGSFYNILCASASLRDIIPSHFEMRSYALEGLTP